MPEKKTTVLGFKDSSGKIYFLSFHRGKDVPPLSSKDIKSISANKRPKLIKSIPPKYPKAALKAGISGSVMINATTDATGKVVDVDVIDGPKELRQVAADAIKQWVYKPYILNNEPSPVRFTVIVKFNLDSKKKKKEPLAISSKKRPKLIKNPPPKYPEKALKECIAGKVVMEAITDEHGRVVSAKVLDGHPELRQAAVGAIKKWVYEPYVLDGVAEPVKFTVIINFKLDNDKNKSNTEESIKLSFKQRPKVIKRVPPAYPIKALKAGISGNVVIEVTCDKKGNVVEATIVEGIPLLNNAALDSIKKWTYEPYLVDGEAKRVSFTVVVKFNLK
ncbi:MAG: energy transducer TonB [bacterium]|nr:energy transducer TonB [bacterium]